MRFFLLLIHFKILKVWEEVCLQTLKSGIEIDDTIGDSSLFCVAFYIVNAMLCCIHAAFISIQRQSHFKENKFEWKVILLSVDPMWHRFSWYLYCVCGPPMFYSLFEGIHCIINLNEKYQNFKSILIICICILFEQRELGKITTRTKRWNGAKRELK